MSPENTHPVQCSRCDTPQNVPARSITVFLADVESIAVWVCRECNRATVVNDVEKVMAMITAGAWRVTGHIYDVRPVFFALCPACENDFVSLMKEVLIFDTEHPYGSACCHVCGHEVPVEDAARLLLHGASRASANDEAMINMLNDPQYQPHAAIMKAVQEAPGRGRTRRTNLGDLRRRLGRGEVAE